MTNPRRMLTIMLVSTNLLNASFWVQPPPKFHHKKPSERLTREALSIPVTFFFRQLTPRLRLFYRHILCGAAAGVTGIGPTLGPMFIALTPRTLPDEPEWLNFLKTGLAKNVRMEFAWFEDGTQTANSIEASVNIPSTSSHHRLQIALFGHWLTELSMDVSESSLRRSRRFDSKESSYPSTQLEWNTPWGLANVDITMRLDARHPLLKLDFNLQQDGAWTPIGQIRMGCDYLRDRQHALPHLDAALPGQTAWLAHIPLQGGDPAQNATYTVTANLFFQSLNRWLERLKTTPRYAQRLKTAMTPPLSDAIPPEQATPIADGSENRALVFRTEDLNELRVALGIAMRVKKTQVNLSNDKLSKMLANSDLTAQTLQDAFQVRISEPGFSTLIQAIVRIQEKRRRATSQPPQGSKQPGKAYFVVNPFREESNLQEFKRTLRWFSTEHPGTKLVFYASPAAENANEMFLERSTPSMEQYLYSTGTSEDLIRNLSSRSPHEIKKRINQIPKDLSSRAFYEANLTARIFGMRSGIESLPYEMWRTWLAYFRGRDNFKNSSAIADFSRAASLFPDYFQAPDEQLRERSQNIARQIKPILDNGTSVLVVLTNADLPWHHLSEAGILPAIDENRAQKPRLSATYAKDTKDLSSDPDLYREMMLLTTMVEMLEHLFADEPEPQHIARKLLPLLSNEMVSKYFEFTNGIMDPDSREDLFGGHLIIATLRNHLDPMNIVSWKNFYEPFLQNDQWPPLLWNMFSRALPTMSIEAIGLSLLKNLFEGTDLCPQPLFDESHRTWFKKDSLNRFTAISALAAPAFPTQRSILTQPNDTQKPLITAPIIQTSALQKPPIPWWIIETLGIRHDSKMPSLTTLRLLDKLRSSNPGLLVSVLAHAVDATPSRQTQAMALIDFFYPNPDVVREPLLDINTMEDVGKAIARLLLEITEPSRRGLIFRVYRHLRPEDFVPTNPVALRFLQHSIELLSNARGLPQNMRSLPVAEQMRLLRRYAPQYVAWAAARQVIGSLPDDFRTVINPLTQLYPAVGNPIDVERTGQFPTAGNIILVTNTLREMYRTARSLETSA